MFKIESNINQVIQSTKIKDLIKVDKIMRELAFDAVALISHRVQQEGKKSDGSNIESKSKKKFGAYSLQYGKKRKSKGRETDHIDMTFTGTMMGDLIPVPEGENSYIIGFRGKHSSDKADWNERKFGKIFQLTAQEQKLIGEIAQKKVNEGLNKSN